MLFFTSDTHFGHANVIKYCYRPFADVQEMNAELVKRWNSRVQPEDTVYHLGDFSFGPIEFQKGICAQLVGRKVLVRGNHDGGVKRMMAIGFHEVVDTALLDLEEGLFRLSHVPPGGVDRLGMNVHAPELSEGVAAFLCGHVHVEWKRDSKRINVGVDVREFEPKTLLELLEK